MFHQNLLSHLGMGGPGSEKSPQQKVYSRAGVLTWRNGGGNEDLLLACLLPWS